MKNNQKCKIIFRYVYVQAFALSTQICMCAICKSNGLLYARYNMYYTYICMYIEHNSVNVFAQETLRIFLLSTRNYSYKAKLGKLIFKCIG